MWNRCCGFLLASLSRLTAVLIVSSMLAPPLSSFAETDSLLVSESRDPIGVGIFGIKPLKRAHEALFEIFVPDELKSDPFMKAELEKTREALWLEIERVPEIKLGFRFFTALEFLTGTLGTRAYYAAFKQPVKTPKAQTIWEASQYLKEVVRESKNKKIIFTSIADLDLWERKELLKRMEESELAWHRRIPMTLRAFYLGGIYKGKVGERVTGLDQLLKKDSNGNVIVDEQKKTEVVSAPELKLKTHLKFDASKNEIVGNLDAIIVGSGVAGSIIASELEKAGWKVLVLEKGPFIHPTLYNSRNNGQFLRNNGILPNSIGDLVIGTSEVAGGGSTINYDIAFPVSHPAVMNHFREWRERGMAPSPLWSESELLRADRYLREKLSVREIGDEEVNSNNRVLWNGALALGRTPSRILSTTLTESQMKKDPTRATNKVSALGTFLLPAMESEKNPVTMIVNSAVERVLTEKGKAVGVEFKSFRTLSGPGISNDLYGFNLPADTKIKVRARHVILSAGAVGSTNLLLKSGVKNKNIGSGIVVHPVLPMIAIHDKPMDHFIGTQSSVYLGDKLTVDYKAPRTNYVVETSIYPIQRAALAIPGNAEETLSGVKQYRQMTGAGVVLIDEPNPANRLVFKKKKDDVVIHYRMTDSDRARMVTALADTADILLKGGAREVLLNTTEKFINPNSEELQIIRNESDIEKMRKNLKVVDATTFMVSGHIMSSNKMGTKPENSVVDLKHRVWGMDSLYVVDAGIFPTSVGANPMMSIYATGYLFAQDLVKTSK